MLFRYAHIVNAVGKLGLHALEACAKAHGCGDGNDIRI
jgi:hypothetical protein